MIFSTHPLHPDVTAELSGLGTLVIATEPAPAAILKESAGASIIVVRAPIPAESAKERFIAPRPTGKQA